MTDPIIAAARFLQAHLDWLRHRSATEIQECFADIAAAARVVAGIARGPQEQRYLGPCGALLIENYQRTETEGWIDESGTMRTCDGDVYGRAGAEKGVCRTCGATVDQAERRAWLDSEVRQRAFTRSDIEDAYGIKANTVTTWWIRAKLTAYWVTDAGLHVEWVELKPDPALKGEALTAREQEIKAEHKARGPKVFYLGDVLDLARQDAARREERRAERERKHSGGQAA